MKILFLDQFSDLGGAQQSLLDLLPAVDQAGWAAHVGLPGDGPLLGRLKSLGAEVHSVPAAKYRSGHKPWNEVLRFASESPGLSAHIRKLAQETAADLVYVNGPRLLPAAAWAARGRWPLLFHCHNHIPQRSAVRLAGRSLRWADATVAACCCFAAEPLEPYVRNGKLHIVHNGVAEGPPRRAAAHASHGPRIGVVGRIAPEKGQAEFLAAARLLVEAMPHWRFLIVGDVLFDDEQARRYRRSLDRLAVGLPVEFLGWREDVYGIMSGLDILVVPSIREPGMARVILEGLACGLPIVAFATGGIPEALVDGETGFLVDPPTPNELATTLLALVLPDPERAANVGQEARSAWRQHFTLERYRRRMLSLIRETAADESGNV
jgi:glycosyltransferase involved in cell wall biosynthesis